MSNWIRTYKRILLPATFAAVILAITLGFAGRSRSNNAPPQEITLIAKDIAFYLADRPGEPNPAIELTSGRTVKLILRNDEPEKVLHCFTIGGMDVATSRDLATGESEAITFTPDKSGTFAYACLMHQAMSGKVVVR